MNGRGHKFLYNMQHQDTGVLGTRGKHWSYRVILEEMETIVEGRCEWAHAKYGL